MLYLRRVLIKQLGMMIVGTLATRAKPNERSANIVKLTTLKVAGVQYGECADTVFVPDEPLRLVPEPSNPYDRYAVAIYRRDARVGYIPRTNSRMVASLIQSGMQLHATVRYFKPDKEPWERLWVSVWMEQNG